MRVQLPPCQFPVIEKAERCLPFKFSLPLYLSNLGAPTLSAPQVLNQSRLDGDQLKNAIRDYGNPGTQNQPETELVRRTPNSDLPAGIYITIGNRLSQCRITVYTDWFLVLFFGFMYLIIANEKVWT